MPDNASGESRMAQISKGLKREMPLLDVPMATKGDSGVELGNLMRRLNQNMSGAIQRMGVTKDAEGVVRILNEVLSQRNKKTTQSSIAMGVWSGRVATFSMSAIG